MDDLGADQLLKLSCNQNKIEQRSAIFNTATNTNESAIAAPTEDRLSMRTVMKKNINGSDSTEKNNLRHSNPSTYVVSEVGIRGEIACGSSVIDCCTMDEDLDQKEKTDVTPENVEKIDDVIVVNNNEISGNKAFKVGGNGIELKIVEDESPTKQSLAFTIDFKEGDSSTASVSAARYKNMVERFQSRHRRGASLSKLDDHNNTIMISQNRTPKVMSTHQNSKQQKNIVENQSSSVDVNDMGMVKLRIRERSASSIRDISKRHSWSPRSSMLEPSEHLTKYKDKVIGGNFTNRESSVNLRQTSTTKSGKISPKPIKVVKKVDTSSSNCTKNTKKPTNFKPRSTALQLALNKVELLCPEPPLDDFTKRENIADDYDSVSETGTYTVDGDNYTEEQKEQMNIDKTSTNASENQQFSNLSSTLPLHTTNLENQKQSNILEINYYHDSSTLKPKISYLEKIKSKVKNITKSPEKILSSTADSGVFTSVTTSGVLSRKPTLDSYPKMNPNRRSSLTKLQVDSSEYVSAENSFNLNNDAPYTDHQKAEYKLNLFTNNLSNQNRPQMLNMEYNVVTAIPPDSPKNTFLNSVVSDTGLKTAQSKNDWIQKWARNARARSQSATNSSIEQISRSYNFGTVDSGSGFDDNNQMSSSAIYHNKTIDRFKNHGIGDFEYSSDPNVSCRKFGNENMEALIASNRGMLNTRPPMSPSKIPSPMHSIGKGRNIIRTRGSLQDLSPLKDNGPDTDVYLQKTAAAISNLTQSFSRKNSLQNARSPPSIDNSPRHLYSQHYSGDEYSPTHTTCQNLNYNIHKRNLSLDYPENRMSHSLNIETLSTILDKQNQSNRFKQHSYDGMVNSPKLFQRKAYLDQSGILVATKPIQQQSPIRRSSSFSTTKVLTGGNTNFSKQQKIISDSKMGKNYTSTEVGAIKNPIQKSASSTSFCKMYSDYDDNISYYINDEDDLVDEYCISSDDYDSNQDECYVPSQPIESEPPEPLTNTRYNKALLMRIERSKQKVSGTQNKSTSGGVVACPNTPETPRRAVQNTARMSVRQSVPRDSSLSRLKNEVPNSLASAKKHLLQTAATTTSTRSVNANKTVQPKYMDISKYKSVQSSNFLRKDETRSTLTARPSEIRRSPSSASVTLNRSEPTRVSNRSIKSAGSRTGNIKREQSIPKQKEVELAMWKRRATYDPMKSAAEDRKKKEEAKKQAQKSAQSSMVLRSQSFHSGVTLITSNKCGTSSQIRYRGSELRLKNTEGSENTSSNDENYRWTFTSTESSDGENNGDNNTNDKFNDNSNEEDEFGEL